MGGHCSWGVMGELVGSETQWVASTLSPDLLRALSRKPKAKWGLRFPDHLYLGDH